MTTYTRTQPTQAELAAYLRRHPGQRYPAVHFATCDTCGARLWMSGLGKGSHERGARHNSAALRRCGAVHPSHPEVLCDELADHTGDHFHSFYMRSWDNDQDPSPHQRRCWTCGCMEPVSTTCTHQDGCPTSTEGTTPMSDTDNCPEWCDHEGACAEARAAIYDAERQAEGAWLKAAESAGEPEPSGFGPGTMLAPGATVQPFDHLTVRGRNAAWAREAANDLLKERGQDADWEAGTPKATGAFATHDRKMRLWRVPIVHRIPDDIQRRVTALQVAQDTANAAWSAYLEAVGSSDAARLNQAHEQALKESERLLDDLLAVPGFASRFRLQRDQRHNHSHLIRRRGFTAEWSWTRELLRHVAEADGYSRLEFRTWASKGQADRQADQVPGLVEVARAEVCGTYLGIRWLMVVYGDMAVPQGACLAEYDWPGRTLRCQRPAGHDGQHEDGDDDTGEQWAWGGPHDDAHLTFPDGDATWTPAESPQDAPGRLEGTRAVSQYPGAPVACCDWALVAYRDVGLVATPDTSARTCQRHPHLDPDDYRMAQAYLLTQGRCQVCDSLMGNHHATDCRMGTGIVAPDLTGWAPGEVTEAYGK